MAPHRSSIRRSLGSITWIAGAALLSATAGAQELPPCSSLPCSTVHTIAASDQAVPLEYPFTIATAGSYQVKLTDLGAQAPFNAPVAYAKLAITSGDTIVGKPLGAPGTAQFILPAGSYVIHITGKPGSGIGSGPVGVEVVSTGGGAPVAQFSGTLALPSSPLASNESILSDSFTVQTGGSYQVALTDLELPQALSTAIALIIAPGASAPVAVLGGGSANTATVTLTAGTIYDVLAVGQAGSSNAGLFSVAVTPTGGTAPAYWNAQPVGTTTLIGNVPLQAGSYTLTLHDLQFPGALAQVGALVTLDGQAVGTPLTRAGTEAITAQAFTGTTPPTYKVFATATAGAGGGSYMVDLTTSSGASLLDVAQGVSAPGGAVLAYGFDATLQSAGTYTLDLADFDVPASLTTLKAAAAQRGALLGAGLSAPGTASISPASGAVSVLVFATPDASSAPSAGLFGVDIAASSSASPVFQATQAVGQSPSAEIAFSSQQVSITNSGSYTVTASDLGFPETFASLKVLVTQGANLIKEISTAGNLTFTASPGNYFVNILAQPQAPQGAESDQAGTYAMSVASAPTAATATLVTNVTSVSSGGTVLLNWSSKNATSCTASSNPSSAGWSGSVATSGMQESAALTQSTTFSLTCTGAGGTSSPASVTVTVTSSSMGKSGGGGAMTPEFLMLLAALAALRALEAVRERRSSV